jgi:hypothetical protein
VRERVRDRDLQIVVMREVDMSIMPLRIGLLETTPALRPYCSETRVSGTRARQVW